MESLQGTRALASAITDMGYATWNIEYRALDQPGGGWPGTYKDWAAALDHLTTVSRSWPIRTDKIVAVGHSAGSAAALWLGYRDKLPRSSEIRGSKPLPLRGAVDIDGPADLQPYIGLDTQICGQPVVTRLIGGTPEQRPLRFAQVTLSGLPAPALPQLLIASTVLPEPFAKTYQNRVNNSSAEPVSVLAVRGGGHFDVIAPGTAIWEQQVGPALKQFLETVTR